MYRLLVLLLLLPATLFSHETLSRPGREEIRLHLFGGPALALQTDTTVTAAAATAASAGSSDAAAERKKPGLAVLYSLLLPGMGNTAMRIGGSRIVPEPNLRNQRKDSQQVHLR